MYEKSLLWDITYDCNLRCQHCYNAEKIQKYKKEEKSLLQYIDWIDKLSDEMGFDHIHFLGGEPLIKDDFYQIVKYASQKGMHTTINTNLTLFDDENDIIDFLHTGIEQITVSLDSPIKEINDAIRGKGVFDKVISNLKKILYWISRDKLDVKVQIATVVTEVNYASLDQFPELLSTLGVRYLSLLSLYQCGSAKINKEKLFCTYDKELHTYLKLIKKNTELANPITVFLDCKPLLIDFINKYMHFCVNKECLLNLPSSGCEEGQRIWFMDPSGEIYPCGPCSQTPSLSDSGVNIMDADAQLVSMKNKFLSLSEKQETICALCMFKDLCGKECPISNQSLFCEYIFPKYKNLMHFIISSNYKINDSIILQDTPQEIQVYDCNKNVFIQLGIEEQKVLREIKYEKKISSFLNSGDDLLKISDAIDALKTAGIIDRIN